MIVGHASGLRETLSTINSGFSMLHHKVYIYIYIYIYCFRVVAVAKRELKHPKEEQYISDEPRK